MNLKIVIEDSTQTSVHATLYSSDTNSNIGTLWVTRDELNSIIESLTYGMEDGKVLEIDDKTLDY